MVVCMSLVCYMLHLDRKELQKGKQREKALDMKVAKSSAREALAHLTEIVQQNV